RGRYPWCLATSTTSRRSFPKGKKKKEESVCVISKGGGKTGMVVIKVASPDRWIRRLSHSLTGFITIAITDATMKDVKNGQAIWNKTGRSAASTIMRKITGPRCGTLKRSWAKVTDRGCEPTFQLAGC